MPTRNSGRSTSRTADCHVGTASPVLRGTGPLVRPDHGLGNADGEHRHQGGEPG
jgi:hypothetical protein